jgi:hypothetical protein
VISASPSSFAKPQKLGGAASSVTVEFIGADAEGARGAFCVWLDLVSARAPKGRSVAGLHRALESVGPLERRHILNDDT